MVVFTCNNCGDSVKKSRAEKHITFECKRKGPTSLCCIDCLKDFKGDTFAKHTKCVSELERYSGKNFVKKPSSNKGERKQSSWVDTVRSILDQPSLNFEQKQLLEAVANFENVPRKKAKFQNFVRCSIRHIKVQTDVIDSVFNLLDKEFKSSNTNSNSSRNDSQNFEEITTNGESTQYNTSVTNGKLESENVESNTVNSLKNRKKKKKQNHNSDQENVQIKPFKNSSEKNLPEKEKEVNVNLQTAENNFQTNFIIDEKNKKTNKKRKLGTDESTISIKKKELKLKTNVGTETEIDEAVLKESSKFKWEDIIKLILENSANEISVKKFTKKVVKKYQNHYSTIKSSEEIMKKCFKKIKKLPDIEVLDDKIKLTS